MIEEELKVSCLQRARNLLDCWWEECIWEMKEEGYSEEDVEKIRTFNYQTLIKKIEDL